MNVLERKAFGDGLAKGLATAAKHICDLADLETEDEVIKQLLLDVAAEIVALEPLPAASAEGAAK